MSKTTAVLCVMNVCTFLCRPLSNYNVKCSNWSLACEQAPYLGLTRDLFWARAAREDWGEAELGELDAITEEFSFLLRLGGAKSHWPKITCINQFSRQIESFAVNVEIC